VVCKHPLERSSNSSEVEDVTLAVGSGTTEILQMVDPAADTLCGAGLTVEYADGRSYSGDPFSVATVKVQVR